MAKLKVIDRCIWFRNERDVSRQLKQLNLQAIVKAQLFRNRRYAVRKALFEIGRRLQRIWSRNQMWRSRVGFVSKVGQLESLSAGATTNRTPKQHLAEKIQQIVGSGSENISKCSAGLRTKSQVVGQRFHFLKERKDKKLETRKEEKKCRRLINLRTLIAVKYG